MKKFSFRFAAVLRQREIVLDQKRSIFAEVERKLALAEELLTQRRQDLGAQLAGGPQAGQAFDARKELVRHRYIFSLRQEIGRREQQMVMVEQELTRARQVVTVAHQDLRAMEILREKDHLAWQHEMKRAEERQIDEHNAQRFQR
ncbi:MAG: flagellar export protein FliJ [Myxococcales bacterium]|nr:flagellar export protein FliJ [Myxococcales bacterium]